MIGQHGLAVFSVELVVGVNQPWAAAVRLSVSLLDKQGVCWSLTANTGQLRPFDRVCVDTCAVAELAALLPESVWSLTSVGRACCLFNITVC